MGGDSLTATKLAAWAGSTFHVTVSASDVLRFQTPSAITTLIEERGAGAPVQTKENPAS